MGIPDYCLSVLAKGQKVKLMWPNSWTLYPPPQMSFRLLLASEPHEPSSLLGSFQGEVSSQSPSSVCSYCRPFLTFLFVCGSPDFPSPYLLYSACGCRGWWWWLGARGHLRVGRDRQSGKDRGRSQGHWRRVIKERGEGGGRESGCEGLWTPTCDSYGDGHGDECLSAFG